ncbi:MAG: DUF47 family protein, partial [Deltaproteobacteria bacterium]|nr:DUF47 family protein [Deltaproteobacteria bacterium]
MLRIFFRKQRELESLIFRYLETFKKTQERFAKALYICMEKSNLSDFDFMTRQTHKFESMADDIREEIKILMYGKVLIPESRGDVMGLLEAMDEIPRLFELILNMIQTQKIKIPNFIIMDLRALIDISMETCDLMLDEVKLLFEKKKGIIAFVARIDEYESRGDLAENRIITQIFDSDEEPFLKLQLKEMVLKIGEISDQA